MKSSDSYKIKRSDKFAWLFFNFILMLGCSIALAVHLPTIGHYRIDSQSSNRFVIHTRGPYELLLDLSDGTTSYARNFLSESRQEVDGIRIRQLPSTVQAVPIADSERPPWKEFAAKIVHQDGNERQVDFSFPVEPVAVDPFTVTGILEDALFALDLNALPLQVQSLKLPADTRQYRVVPIKQSKRFLVLPYYSPALPTDTISMFQLTRAGIEHVTSWPAGRSVTILGDRILSVTPDGTQVEVHSAEDGRSLGTLELPTQVKAAMKVRGTAVRELCGPLLLVTGPDGFKYFDIVSRRPISLPRSDLIPVHGARDRSPIVFFADEFTPLHLLAYDEVNDRTLWQYHANSELTLYGRQNSGEVVIADQDYGLTVHVLDSQTGATLRTFSPFKQLCWLLPSALIGFAVWMLVWLRVAVDAGVPAWINVSLLSSVMIGTQISYVVAWEQWQSTTASLYNYGQGMLLGLALAALVRLVYGRTRLSLRYLPMLGIMVLQILLEAHRITAGSPQKEAAIRISFEYVFVLLAFITIYLFGMRLGRACDRQAPARETGRIPIRDIFIATAAFAMLAAAARPVRFMLRSPSYPLVIATVLLVSVSVLILLTTFARKRHWFILAAALAAIHYAAVVVDLALPFTRKAEALGGYPLMPFRIYATASVTLFFVLLAYRLEGWYLERHVSSLSYAVRRLRQTR